MTGSIVLDTIFKLWTIVNIWYEHSLIHRFIKKLAVYCQDSAIIGTINKWLNSGWNFAEGSLIMCAYGKAADILWRFARRVYTLVKPAADSSLILKVYSWDGFVLKIFRPEVMLSVFVLFMSVVPNDYWSNMYITLAAGAAAVLYFIARLNGADRPAADKARFRIPAALLLYLFIIAVNLIKSPTFSDSLRVTVIAVSCMAVGLLVFKILDTPEKLELFLGAVFAGVVLTSLYALYQYVMGIEVRADLVDLISSPGLRRVFSTMGNPNNYAEYLLLFLPLCVSYALNRKSYLSRFICCGMLLPVALALVLTSSRAAYLVIIVAAGIYVLLTNKRLVPFFILAFVCAIPFLPASIVNRVMTIGADSSSKYRLKIWEASFQVLKNYWVMGVGMGPEAFGRIYRIYSFSDAVNAMHAHNLFAQIWVENGIFGFLAFMAFFVGLLKRLLARALNPANRYHTAALCSLIGITAHGMVEYVWFYPRVMLAFWIVAGIALGLTRGGLNGLHAHEADTI